MSNRYLGQDKGYLGKTERKLIREHGEALEDDENENTEAMSGNDDMNLKTDEISSISLVPSHYSRNSSHRSEKEEGKARRQQQRATVVVTGGALTFVLLAALLVTASFLMSPVIEEMFGKYLSMSLSISLSDFKIQIDIGSIHQLSFPEGLASVC